MKKEIWKDIRKYVGYYQVSNRGRVKSLLRVIIKVNGETQTWPERILKQARIGSKGKELYLGVNLHKDGKAKTTKVHILVATYFVPNPKKLPQVNHIDRDKTNNNDWNLEWDNNRENCSFHQLNIKGKSSKLLGARWDKERKKWASAIRVNGKAIHLGRFDSEKEAANAYKSALKEYGLENRYAA